MLSETFRFLELARIYEINPNDQRNKQDMKNILNDRFISLQDDKVDFSLDLGELHPLNKLGNFGQTLQRKCRLTDK